MDGTRLLSPVPHDIAHTSFHQPAPRKQYSTNYSIRFFWMSHSRNQQKTTTKPTKGHRTQKTSYLHIAFFSFYRYLIGNSFSFRFGSYWPLFFFRFSFSACSSRRFAKRKGVQGLDGERSGSFLFFSSFFFWFWERNGSIDTPSLFIFVFCLLSFFGLGAGDCVADRLVDWFGRMCSSLL